MRPMPITGRPRRKRRAPRHGELFDLPPGHRFEVRGTTPSLGRRDLTVPSLGGPGGMR